MVNKQRRESVDSFSGGGPSKRRFNGKSTSNNEHYLGIKPLPPQPKTKAEPKVVTFELKLPKIKWPKIKLPKIPRKKINKKTLYIVLAAVLILLLLPVVMSFINREDSSNSTPLTQDGATSEQTVPAYKPLVSEQKKESMEGISYDPKRGITSYKDMIDGVEITVSQQPLPATFSEKPEDEVEKLAKSFHATKVITAGKTKAFSGTSSEDGTQTVIFTKNDRLVFIKAAKLLNQIKLERYIIDLQ